VNGYARSVAGDGTQNDQSNETDDRNFFPGGEHASRPDGESKSSKEQCNQEAMERQAPREHREGDSTEEGFRECRGIGHELKKLMSFNSLRSGTVKQANNIACMRVSQISASTALTRHPRET